MADKSTMDRLQPWRKEEGLTAPAHGARANERKNASDLSVRMPDTG
jgi:hypothetical protein